MEEWRCFLCGCRVIWGNDFMFEDYGRDGDRQITFEELEI